MSDFPELSKPELARRYSRMAVDETFEELTQAWSDKIWKIVEKDSERYSRLRSLCPDIRPFMRLGDWTEYRPKRSGDLEVSELRPGMRVVKYNDHRQDRGAEHWLIVSDPREESYGIEGPYAYFIDAKRLEDPHSDPSLLIVEDNDVQTIPLSHWGLTPFTEKNMYITYAYIEMYRPSAFTNSGVLALDGRRYN